MEKRADKIERRLDATTKLISAGMKMLVKQQEENAAFRKGSHEFQRKTREAIHALIEAQMRTDAKLERLIDALSRRNGNGHKR